MPLEEFCNAHNLLSRARKQAVFWLLDTGL